MSLRKYQREAIRTHCVKRDGNSKAFRKEWRMFRSVQIKKIIEQEQKIEADSTPKKKVSHAKKTKLPEVKEQQTKIVDEMNYENEINFEE